MTDSLNIHHKLSGPLKTSFDNYWQRFVETLSPLQAKALAELLQQPQFSDALVHVWTCSDYVAEQCIRNPVTWFELLEQDLQRGYSQDEYSSKLAQQLETVADEVELGHSLRRFRQREMVRIVWRDLMRLAEMEETTGDLSRLADACIEQALQWLYQDSCNRWGVPCAAGSGDPNPQQMIVLGMGKLGALELNLSSDIDLIFAYEAKGSTQGGKRELDNQEFFVRLGQRLIQALDSRTAEGFVFRVDMRLRPYGESGALVLNFDALMEYYQSQGRDWERYAMVKARVVAGDRAAGQRLLEGLRPFVYRRYLDFSAIEALRDMKDMIRREQLRRGLRQDVKLGSGGIREIEFIAQVFQLVRGGRELRLQQRSLRNVLEVLADIELLPRTVTVGLYQAYRFLRNVEHALQAVRDEQTQLIPEDETERARLLKAMGIAGWDDFVSELERHRTFVGEQFNELIAPREHLADENSGGDNAGWENSWPPVADPDSVAQQFRESGYEDPEAAADLLLQLSGGRLMQSLPQLSRQRLDTFMPLMLATVAHSDKPQQTLQRVITLVEAVLRRTAYLVLLVERPQAMQQLVRLCSASPWIAQELAQHPILLDELLDVRQLYQPAAPDTLLHELRQQLLRIAEDDVEQQMECLRHFKRAHVLRVAASEVTGALPLMKVSDYLTYIAEAALKEVLQLAWKHMVARYGTPQDESGAPLEANFIIVAYGKLGGIELSYGSDLDLVFIHNAPASGITSGEKAIENSMFYARLGSRIIHLLTTYTASGQLYDVDMRLRPSGKSGLLVTTLRGFESYQLEQAWVWEHQALARARVVAGAPELADDFENIRKQILCRPRDADELRGEVGDMRRKINKAHGAGSDTASEQRFDLKYGAGGIVDIEFIVQYAVLAWAHEHASLVTYSDNIRILDALEKTPHLNEEDAGLLREAYKCFRSVIHRQAIEQQSAVIDWSGQARPELAGYRDAVIRIWRQLIEAPAH